MFDSMYDAHGAEWQTKAFARELSRFQIGDEAPHPDGVAWPTPAAYQVRVFGGGHDHPRDSYATIRDGRVAAVPAIRNEALPLVDYHGGWLVAPEEI